MGLEIYPLLKRMKEKLIIGLGGGVLVILLALAAQNVFKPKSQTLGAYQIDYVTQVSVSSTQILTGSTVLIAPTNTARLYLRVEPIGAGMWIGFSSSTLTKGQGEFVPASTTVTFNLDNLWTGSLYALADTQNATATVEEFSRKIAAQ